VSVTTERLIYRVTKRLRRSARRTTLWLSFRRFYLRSWNGQTTIFFKTKSDKRFFYSWNWTSRIHVPFKRRKQRQCHIAGTSPDLLQRSQTEQVLRITLLTEGFKNRMTDRPKQRYTTLSARTLNSALREKTSFRLFESERHTRNAHWETGLRNRATQHHCTYTLTPWSTDLPEKLNRSSDTQ
jgi:hypothetical protein